MTGPNTLVATAVGHDRGALEADAADLAATFCRGLPSSVEWSPAEVDEIVTVESGCGQTKRAHVTFRAEFTATW